VRDRSVSPGLPIHRESPPPDWPDWPVVDGIDANDVAQRLDGDVAVFHVLLGLFIDELDDLECALSTTPSGEQVAQIAQRLHKLRGTAGNLGARDLYAVANETERALREERMPAAIEGLRRVLEQLARLRRSVTAMLDAASSSATDVTMETSSQVARSTLQG
jgi:HPt (histidine-containing phosphotransfer) domain-containing protein